MPAARFDRRPAPASWTRAPRARVLVPRGSGARPERLGHALRELPGQRHEGFEAGSDALGAVFRGLRSRVPRVPAPFPALPDRHLLFESERGYGHSPQMWRLSSVHILGTGKLSRSCPQAALLKDHQTRSAPCGFVDEDSPQPVDDEKIHRVCAELSTVGPQIRAGCPQRSPASPHLCPLFGNAPSHLTASSERRHTEVPDWPVGNRGKAGDDAGEKSPLAVDRVCRTFRRPQIPRVVHRLHPQGRWTKNRL